jgi:hypothetical protein
MLAIKGNSMIHLVKTTLKKIPGLQALVRWTRLQIGVRRASTLLRRLYPLSTNRELVRFGPKGDGGYLIPNDLAGIHACFSLGVGPVSGFEKDCANLGMKVFLADGSVEGPAEEHELFYFVKKFIGGTPRDGFMTLDDWVVASIDDKASDLMMQIDIEGHEYEVFLAASEGLMQRFRIIVAEFHGLDRLLSVGSKEIVHVFNKILRTHSCVHIHPNNCYGSLQHDGISIPRIMEFTFLRHDRINQLSYHTSFPHPLDCDNTPNSPLILPKCWYGLAESRNLMKGCYRICILSGNGVKPKGRKEQP